MKTLLIWRDDQNTPHIVALYLIEDAPEWLAECHGSYINGGIDPNLEALLFRVSDALAERKEDCYLMDDELSTAWAKFRVDDYNRPLRLSDVQVIQCGYLAEPDNL